MLKKDYSKKKYQHPLKQKTKKPKRNSRGARWGRRLGVTTVTLFVIGFLGYVLFISPAFQAETIQIKGTSKPHVNTIVTSWLSDQSQQLRWGIVPANNMMVLSTEHLKNTLESDLYIETASVSRKAPKTIAIEITPKNATILYSVSDKRYLIDEQGNTIQEVTADSDVSTIGIPVVLGTTTQQIITATHPTLDSKLVSFIENLSNEFPKFVDNVAIQSIEMIPGDVELKVNTDKPWYVLFNSQSSLTIQLSNLTRAIDELIPVNELNRLEYIDVRIENYIYYK